MSIRIDWTQDILSQTTANALNSMEINRTQKCLYMFIKDNLNENYVCRLTNQELWELLGIHKRTISRNIWKLIEAKLITDIRNNYSKDNRKRILKINK